MLYIKEIFFFLQLVIMGELAQMEFWHLVAGAKTPHEKG